MDGQLTPTAADRAEAEGSVAPGRCPLCPLQDLDLGVLKDALARCEIVSAFEAPAGARIRIADYGEGHLLTLHEGLLKFGMTHFDGHSAVAGLRYPGDPIEPYCKLDGGEAFLEAVLDSTICVIDLQVVERDPGVATRVLTRRLDQVNSLLRSAERHHSAFIGQPPETRIAILLLQLLEKPIHRIEPEDGSDRPSIRLFLSRGEIADCLGLAVETVSRTLGRMVEAGLIAKQGRNRIRIDDLAGLGRRAGLPPKG